jgi:hypothetical protein
LSFDIQTKGTFQEVITATFQKLEGDQYLMSNKPIKVNVDYTIDYKLNLGEVVVEVE